MGGSGGLRSRGLGQGGLGQGFEVGGVGVDNRKEPSITMLHVQVSSDRKNGSATAKLKLQ